MTNFTEIYNEYKPQIEKLNKQFKKLQKHTQDLSYTDLKLHDVAYYIGHNEIEIKAFENYCDIEYDYFTDWLQENNLKIEQIGRTLHHFIFTVTKVHTTFTILIFTI